MGAGILPVTIYNGIILFLMGKERYNNLWCDFGGSSEYGEQHFETALREGGEELNGILGLDSVLQDKITNSMITPIEFNRYTSFLFYIDYDRTLINTFKNSNNFAETYLCDLINKKHNGLFEKNEIRWFTLDELRSNIKLFRPHYIPIINTIMYHENTIYKSALKYKKPNNYKNYKRNNYNKPINYDKPFKYDKALNYNKPFNYINQMNNNSPVKIYNTFT